MNIRILLVLVFVIGLACAGFAQRVTPDQQKQSEQIMAKVRKLELYNQLLPVLMTPAQAKAFLPLLEKHRAEADKQELEEYRLLLGLEKELDTALAAATEKGRVPDEPFMKKVFAHFQAFLLRRKALIDESVQTLKAHMKATLNEGQVSSAARAFNPTSFGVDFEGKEITEDVRLEYWIRMVLLDNTAYEVMVELSRPK